MFSFVVVYIFKVSFLLILKYQISRIPIFGTLKQIR